MSDTDDTDVLLLIPPNFFLVQSSGSDDSLLESSRTVVQKPQSCTAQVIGKLVNHVHSLESRLESLENTSTSDNFSASTISNLRNNRSKSWVTDSFDSSGKSFTFPRRRRRKQKKERDLSLTSLDSQSVQSNIPPLKLKSKAKPASIATISTDDVNDSPTMDGDLSSIVSTPSKKNDKLLLHEIDEFLTKVEAYESPDAKHKDQDCVYSPDNVIKATGDYISQKLDYKSNADDIKLPSGRFVSSNVLDKYIYLVKNNSSAQQSERAVPATAKMQESSSITNPPEYKLTVSQDTSKVEIKSPSIRKLNFCDTKDLQPTSTPKRIPPTSSYTDTFRPSSNKIYDRATKVLEQYKSQNYSEIVDYSTSPKREEFKMPQIRPYVADNKTLQHRLMDTIDTELLSLSELWGEKGERADRVEGGKLEEERLKREHCEAMIQQLQKKLLDQQERLAVALKVDRAKDSAISKLKDAWMKITGSLDKAEERHRSALEKMLREVDKFKTIASDAQKKTSHFEAELYKALDLAHDYQDKCKRLLAEKTELRENTQKTIAAKEEAIKAKDKEIEVMKENYDTVMRLNKQSGDCIKNLEDSLAKEKIDHEQTKSKASELGRKVQSINEEMFLIQQDRDLVKEKVNEERARSNMLERQLADKQNLSSELMKKCDALDTEVKVLHKHLELQKSELKSHYQKQLEDAVLSKLDEFQQQLQQAEREMESDTRKRENVLLETYNKQLENIHEQHKLEVNVLEEKQKEEIKLYRLQLAQSGEKIGLLENKLESYRRRRGEIASQLHSVMESQWRQALRILTDPHANVQTSSLDVTRQDIVSTPTGQDYAPPKIPPLTMPSFADKGLQRADGRRHVDRMFNFEGLSDNELQQYVKMLLTKPPTLDGSGDSPLEQKDIEEEPTSDRPDRHDKKDKLKRSLNSSKPPWKS